MATATNIMILLEKFREKYPGWSANAEMMKAVRAAFELCETTHPGWIGCSWCRGLGWVHDDSYSGTCPMCNGQKGKWNTRETQQTEMRHA